ncbi:hypothetical protein [Collimonas arenae]|uniref:hypothetical protein n=1 Tax=Collimonas arenae TaxID=279058 RepID=UPI00056EFDE9|nr:hypothetical protein [Collimonas arenae]
MNVENWKSEMRAVVCAKLHAERDRFGDRQLLRFDVGIFPWHGWIELSLLFTEEAHLLNDVATWPYYNFSEQQEGKWPQVDALCKEMAETWSANFLNSETFFIAVADVIRSDEVQNAIASFKRDEGFCVTLLNPDNAKSPNYYI